MLVFPSSLAIAQDSETTVSHRPSYHITTIGHNPIDQKPDASAHEHMQPDKEPGVNAEELALDNAAQGQGVSGFENLTWWETVKAFKVTVAICFAVTFSAATDGYQIG